MRLIAGDASQTQPFDLVKDPRVAATREDLEDQFALLVRIRDKISQTHEGIARLRNVGKQVDEWSARAAAVGKEEPLKERAGALKAKLDSLVKSLCRSN